MRPTTPFVKSCHTCPINKKELDRESWIMLHSSLSRPTLNHLCSNLCTMTGFCAHMTS